MSRELRTVRGRRLKKLSRSSLRRAGPFRTELPEDRRKGDPQQLMAYFPRPEPCSRPAEVSFSRDDVLEQLGPGPLWGGGHIEGQVPLPKSYLHQVEEVSAEKISADFAEAKSDFQGEEA